MKKDIIDLFETVDNMYPDLTVFTNAMEVNNTEIYKLYTEKHGTQNGHTLYMNCLSIVGTKAWFKVNPKSYTTIDYKGAYFLTRGFILGMIGESFARKILNKHLKKHNGKAIL
jgi:hypothetical protein